MLLHKISLLLFYKLLYLYDYEIELKPNQVIKANTHT